MSCESIRQELIGFHFGEVDEAARSDLERHLVTCPACLGEFLSLKRDVERSASVHERPSAKLKANVRSAVATHLGLGPAPRLWWERPLAYGVAAAALIIAMVSVQSIATSPPGRAPTVQRSR
jgi:anti-sigma factor RsiW